MLYVILARQHYFLFLYRFYLLYILFLHFLQQLLIVFHLIIGLPTTVLFGIIIILLHRSSPFLSIILSFAFSLLFLFKLVVLLSSIWLLSVFSQRCFCDSMPIPRIPEVLSGNTWFSYVIYWTSTHTHGIWYHFTAFLRTRLTFL